MEKIIVHGGQPLRGTLRVQGSKNASLPILAACVLADGVCEIENCPDLSDVRAAVRILEHLGCIVSRAGDQLTVDSQRVSCYTIPDTLMHEMRSSIVFLGSVLARTGKAALCAPGGCEIGLRPIDLHLSALRALGAVIAEENGTLRCETPKKLQGTVISLSFPSVGATENVLLAAATAGGTTWLLNAAREPEIEDLVRFLNACGADIETTGEGTLVIRGVSRLHGCRHRVIPDRIAALSFMAAVGAAGGDVVLEDVRTKHILSVNRVFEQAGCRLETDEHTLHIRADGRLRAVRDIRTLPHPGFPTDAQAAVMAMLCTAQGTSVIVETIFENRFHHVHGLCRMGARIRIEDRVAIIDGVPKLHGAAVSAVDLRAGAALIIASLGAEGTSIITGLHHIDRGYEKIEACLQTLGAQIERSAESGRQQSKQNQPVRRLPLR